MNKKYPKICPKVIPTKDAIKFAQVFGGLPNKSEAVAYFKGSPVVDTIGLSSIAFTVGDASDFENSTFQFDYNATMAGVDTSLGGGVLFTGVTPIARTYNEWLELLNIDYLWIGPKGIAAYSTDQSGNALKIMKFLGVYQYSIFVNSEQMLVDGEQLYIGA